MVFLDIYDDGKLFWIVREYYWDSTVEMRQKTDAEYADDLATSALNWTSNKRANSQGAATLAINS